MWGIEPTAEYEKRFNRWKDKHRRELAAMAANLRTVQLALQNGAKVEHIRFGFVHPEAKGVIAVDQKGGGAGLKQCRLYVYIDKDTKTIHAITIGDKSTQRDDVKFSKEFVESLLSGK